MFVSRGYTVERPSFLNRRGTTTLYWRGRIRRGRTWRGFFLSSGFQSWTLPSRVAFERMASSSEGLGRVRWRALVKPSARPSPRHPRQTRRLKGRKGLKRHTPSPAFPRNTKTRRRSSLVSPKLKALLQVKVVYYTAPHENRKRFVHPATNRLSSYHAAPPLPTARHLRRHSLPPLTPCRCCSAQPKRTSFPQHNYSKHTPKAASVHPFLSW